MTVLLLHGLGRTSISMRFLDLKLANAGFETQLMDYPSRSKTIAELTAILESEMPKEGRVDMVGHSLGGLLAKRLMRNLEPARRGRIVQLGAPNFGSEIAERAEILEPIMGPALAELSPNDGTDDDDLEIGAIAGTAAINALSLLTGIEGENDGKVSVESAWGNAPVECRIKLPVAHSTMMLSSDVIDATIEFLETGEFSKKWSE